VTPRRILRTTDMLDHGLVAEAENLALTRLGSIVHSSACRVSDTTGGILQSCLQRGFRIRTLRLISGYAASLKSPICASNAPLTACVSVSFVMS
jgi:hypothetical protein